MRRTTLLALFLGIVAAALAAEVFSARTIPDVSQDGDRHPALPDTNEPPAGAPRKAVPAAAPLPSQPQPEPRPQPVPVVVPPEIAYANRSKKQVVFTFDGGAGVHSYDEIVATFAKHGLTTTFFVTGKWAAENPSLIRDMAARGHEVFNHTYTHPELTKLSATEIKEEFRRTETTISGLTGKTTKPYFRPPYGDRNAAVLRAAAEEGYQSVYWSTDALDWKPGITDAEVKARIYNGLANGAIYLMHIGDDITGRILDEVIEEVQRRGYAIVPFTAGMR